MLFVEFIEKRHQLQLFMDRKIQQLEDQLIEYWEGERMLKDESTREKMRQQNIVEFAESIERAKAAIKEVEDVIFRDGCGFQQFPHEVKLAWKLTEAMFKRMAEYLAFDPDSELENGHETSGSRNLEDSLQEKGASREMSLQTKKIEREEKLGQSLEDVQKPIGEDKKKFEERLSNGSGSADSSPLSLETEEKKKKTEDKEMNTTQCPQYDNGSSVTGTIERLEQPEKVSLGKILVQFIVFMIISCVFCKLEQNMNPAHGKFSVQYNKKLEACQSMLSSYVYSGIEGNMEICHFIFIEHFLELTVPFAVLFAAFVANQLLNVYAKNISLYVLTFCNGKQTTPYEKKSDKPSDPAREDLHATQN